MKEISGVHGGIRKPYLLRLFRKCFGNSVTKFSFPSNLNFIQLSRIQGA